jgi:hypothetical protein
MPRIAATPTRWWCSKSVHAPGPRTPHARISAGYALGLPVDAVVAMCGPDLLEDRVRARWGAERVPGLPEDEHADEQRSQQEIAEEDSRRSHFVPSNRLAAQC